jgi:hypothetical protein
MQFRRDDFVPENGTLTVRYMVVGLGSEHEFEVRADANNVEVNISCSLSYEDMEGLVDVLVQARRHHARLKHYGEPMPGGEPRCVVEYEKHDQEQS